MSNVYYCGEIARNFEDGVLRDLDGFFEAGLDFAKSGVIIRNVFPGMGVAHRQEFSPGEAEDIIQNMDDAAVPSDVGGGDNELFPCTSGGCPRCFDFAPLNPKETEFKYHKRDIGFVLAVAMEDGEITGEREELICVGPPLDVLSDDPDCGIGNPSSCPDAVYWNIEICRSAEKSRRAVAARSAGVAAAS